MTEVIVFVVFVGAVWWFLRQPDDEPPESLEEWLERHREDGGDR